LVRKFAKQT